MAIVVMRDLRVLASIVGCVAALGLASSSSGAARPNTGTVPTTQVTFNASAVTPSGEIVVAGFAAPSRPIVARFGSDGSLDPTFGERGYVFPDPPTAPSVQSGAAVAVTPSGEIVVFVPNGGSDTGRLQRLTTRGEIDRSFGIDGMAAVNPSLHVSGSADPLALDSSGRILIAGSSGRALALERFTADGLPDPSFDGDGFAVATPVPPSSVQQPASLQWGELVAVRPDDRPFVIGEAVTDSGEAEVVGAQFDTAGALDPSFDGDGMTRIPASGPGVSGGTHYAARAVALEASGSALIRLEVRQTVPDLYPGCAGGTIVRLRTDGTLDPTYGDSGFAQLDGHNCARDFAVLDSGGIFGVGLEVDRNVPTGATQVLYNAAGQLDPAFAPQPRRLSIAGFSSWALSVSQLPGPTLITVGNALVPRCTTPGQTQCTLGFVLATRPDGEVVSDFGTRGVTTLPRTRICADPFERCPYPYQREFRRLARHGVGPDVELVDGALRPELTCNAEIRERCYLRAWFTAPGSNRVLARLPKTRVTDGRTVRPRSTSLGDSAMDTVLELSSLDIHATVSAAHQRPVRVLERAAITTR